MKRARNRTFSREFKLWAVERMLSGANVSALARELTVLRKDLYKWRDRFRALGADGLRPTGRPPRSVAAAAPPLDALQAARQRIAELERKVGQQHLELDFFRQALRQVGAQDRASDGSGAKASIASSKR
jgi:transposase